MNALFISALLGIVMMFSGIVFKKHAQIRTTAILGIIVLIIANCLQLRGIKLFHFDVSSFMVFDQFTLVFYGILLIATLLYFLVSAPEITKVGNYHADYYALIFFILLGVGLVLSFKSLLTLFLGIEIISIPLYILTGADKKNLKSNEAALKYFLMGSFSTGIMLMGMALIYGSQGTFFIDNMHFVFDKKADALQVAGVLFLLFSLCFKASVAPFHFWTPDVYDGAPTVFTSFMATIVKAAFFLAFVKLFHNVFATLAPVWQFWVAILVALTLFFGNITAVFQQSIKRMLSYSSIAQAGFMLIAVLSFTEAAKEGLVLYAAAYCFASIGIFAVLAKVNDYSIAGFNGLAKQEPLLALTTTIFLLSLAGIPLTAGFIAKFYMLKALVLTGNGQYLWLVIFAVIMAAVSAYYYFKVIQAMYFKDGDARVTAATPFQKYTLLAIAVLVLLIGIFPSALLNWLYF